MEKYETGRALGKGSYGTVFLVREKGRNRQWVMKYVLAAFARTACRVTCTVPSALRVGALIVMYRFAHCTHTDASS